MQYILIQLENGVPAYQELLRGYVQRICSLTGETIDGIGGSFVVDTNPPQPTWALPDTPIVPVIGEARIISKLDYMSRFTDSELAAIFTAAKSVVAIEVWLEKFKVAEFINLDDAATQAGLQTLETVGLIGVGRAMEVLNA